MIGLAARLEQVQQGLRDAACVFRHPEASPSLEVGVSPRPARMSKSDPHGGWRYCVSKRVRGDPRGTSIRSARSVGVFDVPQTGLAAGSRHRRQSLIRFLNSRFTPVRWLTARGAHRRGDRRKSDLSAGHAQRSTPVARSVTSSASQSSHGLATKAHAWAIASTGQRGGRLPPGHARSPTVAVGGRGRLAGARRDR
jgi:hypothetical protein